MFGLFITALAALLCGCDDNPLTRAEQLMAGFECREALGVLQSVGDAAGSDDYHRLLVEALVVEGRTDSAFGLIREIIAARPQLSSILARAVLNGVRAVAREKGRIGYALALLDSAVAISPESKSAAVDIAWERGLEYLAATGDQGLHLMRWANANDPQSEGRLRAFNPPLAARYAELDAVDRALNDAASAVGRFQILHSRPPGNFAELFAAFPEAHFDTARTGWTFSLIIQGDSAVLRAEAIPKHPAGIPWGTILAAH